MVNMQTNKNIYLGISVIVLILAVSLIGKNLKNNSEVADEDVSLPQKEENVAAVAAVDPDTDKTYVIAYFYDTDGTKTGGNNLTRDGITYPVLRKVEKTVRVADASLKVIFEENRPLIKSSYKGVSIKDGIATVDFAEGAGQYLQAVPEIRNSYAWPMERTLLQFPSVKEVKYSINGKVITG